MEWNKIIKEMNFLLGIAIISAFTVNFFSPKGIALVGQWGESQSVIASTAQSDVFSGQLEIKQVKTEKQIYDKDNAVFVDARPLENFKRAI
jgi:hypothetical protein